MHACVVGVGGWVLFGDTKPFKMIEHSTVELSTVIVIVIKGHSLTHSRVLA